MAALVPLAAGRRRPAGRLTRVVPILLAPLLAGSWSVHAQAPPVPEYQLKAIFLFNFAQFVEWPSGALPAEDNRLVIGVLGDDPMGAFLDEAVRGERVGPRVLTVERYHRVEEIKHCHILFISRSESGRLEVILAQLKGKSILTIGDLEGFAWRGGMIGMITEKNRLRLRTNLAAAREAHLTLSSKLLRSADIVGPRND